MKLNSNFFLLQTTVSHSCSSVVREKNFLSVCHGPPPPPSPEPQSFSYIYTVINPNSSSRSFCRRKFFVAALQIYCLTLLSMVIATSDRCWNRCPFFWRIISSGRFRCLLLQVNFYSDTILFLARAELKSLLILTNNCIWPVLVLTNANSCQC